MKYVLAGILVLSVAAHAVAPKLYVSTEGDDAWSGLLPAPNADQTDGPLASLTRARDVLLSLKKQAGLPKGATVYVRGGSYYMAETFTLRKEHSGAPGARIVYRAFEGEKPVLVGGLPIQGFTQYKGEILKADVSSQGFKGFYFRQLFFNGKRQHLARYPNFEPDAPICGGWAFIPGEPQRMYGAALEETIDQRRTLKVRPEDIHDWANPGTGEIFLFPRHNWWNHIVPIESVDKTEGIIKLKPNRGFDSRLGDRRFGMKPRCRYYVRNLLEELDAPGEWYLDRTTWTLYFWPPAPLEGATVVAPRTSQVIHLHGGTSHITIRGFIIECGDRFGVNMYRANDCLIAGCTVRNVSGQCRYGDAAIAILGGTNNGAVGNDIHDVGCNGVTVSGGDRETLTPGSNYADNNYIHHAGVFWKAGSGVSCSGVGNRVSHNLVHDTPRQGLRWNGSDHLIEFNRVHHTNTEISDTAGINACNSSWTKRGTVIRYNYVHDTLGFGMNRDYEWVSPYYCWSIYLDNFTCGTTVYGNICARIILGGPFIHGGRDNIIENNYVIDCNTAQMQYSSWKPNSEKQKQGIVNDLMTRGKLAPYQKYPGLSEMFSADYDEWVQMAGNKFLRNICTYSDPKALLYKQRNLPLDKTESDYNLVWHHGMPMGVGLKDVAQEKQWEEWRKLGFEEHSIVADPMFVDVKNDDFRLKPDSPAHKLGIQQIPVDKIGPYQHELRASWPIVEAEGIQQRPHRLDRMLKPPPRTAFKAGPRSTFRVPRLKTPIVIDGDATDAEWSQVDLRRGITLQQNPRGAEAKPRSFAYMAFDDQHLYISFRNQTDGPLRRGSTWGKGTDAVEVALRIPDGSIVVLRGFVDGTFESSTEAGASIEAAKRAEASQYGAKAVSKTSWSAEWRIPFAALGADPAQHKRFDCNLTVRKTASNLWLMWRGTHGSSWQVDRAAVIKLGRPD
ncbi:MAG: right-handed parallel beta-helix repeat-containing protein [Lentisphaeria bacterium]|nr:right-handed parallel beta-helix repeat-containing protein [Lentisphaeria bacterium]